MIIYIVALALGSFQDVPIEEITIPTHDFALGPPQNSSVGSVKLARDPLESHRHYFLKLYDSDGGQLLSDRMRHEGMAFWEIVEKALAYGLKDTDSLEYPNLNRLFRDFVKSLHHHNLLNDEDLRTLVKKYLESTWIESLYWLDEAFPGLVSKEQWEGVFKNAASNNSGFYFGILVKIKLSKLATGDVADALKWADKGMLDPASLYSATGNARLTFQGACKGYAELVRCGAVIGDEVELSILQQYEQDDMIPLTTMKAFFNRWGMALPRRNAVVSFLRNRVINGDKIQTGILASFREFKVPFPQEKAVVYLEELLGHFGERGTFEDVEYLLPMIKPEDLPIASLKSYGDSAIDWHFNDTSALRKNDTEDYIRFGVECYRLVKPRLEAAKKAGDVKLVRQLSISPENVERLRKLIDDSDVRLLDIARIYEITGIDPRLSESDFIKDKLDRRMRLVADRPTGAYDETLVKWHTDKSGRPILLFRDELEFALYFSEHQLLRKVFDRITHYVIRQMIAEGVAYAPVLREYEQRRCIEPTDFTEHASALSSDESAAHANLDAIILFLIKEQDVTALRIFGQYLRDAGFVFRARPLLHLGGLGKEAEAAYYKDLSDAHWKESERRFNLAMRLSGLMFE